MITLKSKREIDAMEESGALLASIHVQLRDFIKPGVTTWDIDQFIWELASLKSQCHSQHSSFILETRL